MWTRVISLYGDDLTLLKAHKTAIDLLIVDGFEPMQHDGVDQNWRPLFYSKDFVQENPDMTLGQYRIGASRLQEYGVGISVARKQIRALASKLDASIG